MTLQQQKLKELWDTRDNGEPTFNSAHVSRSDRKPTNETLVAALMREAGYSEQQTIRAFASTGSLEAAEETVEQSRRLYRRGASLHEVIRECRKSEGESVKGGVQLSDIHASLDDNRRSDANSLTATGFSTISLPGILSSLLNKAMLAAYRDVNGVGLDLCSTTSTKDFKKFSRYRMTEEGIMEQVPASGEIKHGTLIEEQYENQVHTYGKLLSITDQMLKKDDVGAMLQLPKLLGRSGRIGLEEAIFSTLVNAPTIDGAGTDEFFHSADRGHRNPNYVTGAAGALSFSGYKQAIDLFQNRSDAGGKPISLEPSMVFVSSTNATIAKKLFKDPEFRFTHADTLETVGNEYQGVLEPKFSPWLRTLEANVATYYVVHKSSVTAPLSLAFLDNRRSPIIERSKSDLNFKGIAYRAYWDWGVALHDSQAVVKMQGFDDV